MSLYHNWLGVLERAKTVFDIVCESSEFVPGSLLNRLAIKRSHGMVLVNDSILVITLLEDDDQFLILVCSYGCPGQQL